MAAAASPLPHDHSSDWVYELQRLTATADSLPGAACLACWQRSTLPSRGRPPARTSPRSAKPAYRDAGRALSQRRSSKPSNDRGRTSRRSAGHTPPDTGKPRRSTTIGVDRPPQKHRASHRAVAARLPINVRLSQMGAHVPSLPGSRICRRSAGVPRFSAGYGCDVGSRRRPVAPGRGRG